MENGAFLFCLFYAALKLGVNISVLFKYVLATITYVIIL